MDNLAKYSKINELKLIKNKFPKLQNNQFKDELFTFLTERFSKDYKVPEKNEHELTRKHIAEKIEDLSLKIATKEELIKSKEEIICNIKKESLATQEKLKSEIEELRSVLLSYLPHKRAFKISFYFVALFLFFIFSEYFFNIQIINKFWGSVGLCVSGGFLVMSYFLFLDWKRE